MRANLWIVLVSLALLGSASAGALEKRWVIADRLERKTCPSSKCGTVGQLLLRESVDVLEVKDGWVRISRLYSASCYDGKSDYIKSGNARCSPDNGVYDGKFAEWVESRYLSVSGPADPCEYAVGDDKMVCGSDDYHRYKNQFTSAARKLIQAGVCVESDFRDIGGWSKSNSMGATAYFVYCGGMALSNKIYLDVLSGELSVNGL